MTKRINVKAVAAMILALILGGYVIFYIKNTLGGILVIAAGISLNLLEVVKWFKELISLFKEDKSEINQNQDEPLMSPQFTVSGGKVEINYYPSKNEEVKEDIPKLIQEEIKSHQSNKVSNLIEYDKDYSKKTDIKKNLIEEINSQLSSSHKISDILIKCVRLATMSSLEKDIFWLENELEGFEKNKDKIKEEDIPDYRVVDTEIRIVSTDSKGYTPINFKLTLGHPIFEIEEWINKYLDRQEMLLSSPMTPTLKKTYKETFGKEAPTENIPYIIKTRELKKVMTGLKLRISKFVNSIEKENS